jgi:hypothetical protein
VLSSYPCRTGRVWKPCRDLRPAIHLAIFARKRDLKCRLAAGALRRLPGPTRLPHGTADDFLVPIHLNMADSKGVGIMSLPALILTHGTYEVNLVLVLTCGELFARGVGPIAQVDPW